MLKTEKIGIFQKGEKEVQAHNISLLHKTPLVEVVPRFSILLLSLLIFGKTDTGKTLQKLGIG